MKMAFGHAWENEDKLKAVCGEIAALSELPQWRNIETVCRLIMELHKEKYNGMTDILSVRENAGVIAGIKKVLALPEECRQVISQDNK
jgi:hypothetical protein